MPGMMIPGAAVSIPGMGPADTATYGRAKEQTGLQTQAALKGLRESLAARGLGGSGVDAQETGKVFSGGLSDLAETQRQIAEGASARNFQSTEAAKGREFSAAEEGLRAAMGTPASGGMGSPDDPYGTKAAARMQAVFEAKQRLQSLTGYSMPSGSLVY